jgi:DNA-binding transcriptional ArsR family regulator
VPERYEMAQSAEQIGLTNSRLFLTRPKGEKAYKILKKRLLEVTDSNALVLAFPATQLVDGSFADETVVQLGLEILRGDFGERCLLLEGLTRDSIKNINAVISLRKHKLPLLAVEHSGEWQILGRLEEHLLDTLKLVAKHGRLTATELMSILDLAVNTASTRLKRLHNLHLVHREFEITERGLQYHYHFWRWADE